MIPNMDGKKRFFCLLKLLLVLTFVGSATDVLGYSCVSGIDAGDMCSNTIAYDCAPGCYCPGASGNHNCAWTTKALQNHCASTEGGSSPEQKGGEEICSYAFRCPSGFQFSATGTSSITKCYGFVPGKKYRVSNSTKSYTDYDCPAGYYCPGGNTNPVYYNSGGGKKPCPAGKYSSAGAASCTACPAGRYASSTGSSSCKTCSAGTYASGTGNTSCTACPAGRYTSSTGSLSCKTCSAGTYASGTGNTSCSSCPAGKYSSAGAASCSSCPAGTSALNPGTASCDKCNSGFYASGEGNTSCTQCTGDGKAVITKNGLNIGCAECDAGYFAADATGTEKGNIKCVSCPEGYYCVKGIKNKCESGYYASEGASECTLSRTGATNENQSAEAICEGSNGQYIDPTSKKCASCVAPEYIGSGKMYVFSGDDNQTGITSCQIKLNTTESACDSSTKVIYKYDSAKKTYVLESQNIKGGERSIIKSDADFSKGEDWCEMCPAGEYPNQNTNKCGACPKGSCVEDDACTPCPAGYYCDTENMLCKNKQLCNEDTYSLAGSSQCTTCPIGTATIAEKDESGTTVCSDQIGNKWKGCTSPLACQLFPARLCYNTSCKKKDGCEDSGRYCTSFDLPGFNVVKYFRDYVNITNN